MKRYLLSVYQPGSVPPPPEVLGPIIENVKAFRAEAQRAGVWVFAGGLYPPSTATVVRPNGNELLITDGPYIESKEVLGGLTIIQVPDLDAALEWAGKAARATTLPIEVRPFQDDQTH
jgi:hypothetical protein